MFPVPASAVSVIRTVFTLVALTASVALSTRASADDRLLSVYRREVFLVVNEPATGYPTAYQGFWSNHPDATAPTYNVYYGSAPGLTATPIDVPAGAPGHSDVGVHVTGTPTQVGEFVFQCTSSAVNVVLDIHVYVFKDAATRDAVANYTEQMLAAVEYDTYYWAALRGYFIGIGINDQGLAGFSYYYCLADYYTGHYFYVVDQPQYGAYFKYVNYANAWYFYYAEDFPNYAAYLYYSNYAVAYYYFFEYSGDTQSAVYFYNLYRDYAEAVR